MTIRLLLQLAIILYSHNAILCPPKWPDARNMGSEVTVVK